MLEGPPVSGYPRNHGRDLSAIFGSFTRVIRRSEAIVSLNPDYMYRMAKLIQQERRQEADGIRRWLGLRRPAVDLSPTGPGRVASETEFESRKKAS